MRLKGIFAAIVLVLMIMVLILINRYPDDPVIAFIDVNLVPMTENIVLKDQTVLVNGAQIIEVGPSDQIPIKENMVVINGEGKYLLPGLADMHMHTREDWDDQDIWPVSPLSLYIANGVTTIRDFGPSGSEIIYPFRWRDEISAGLRIGPSIITSGKILYKSPLVDPAGLVIENYSSGFDFLKVYSYPFEEDLRIALQKADELDFYSSGHIPFSVGLQYVISLGLDEIAHVEELLYEFIDFDRDQELQPDEWWNIVRAPIVARYMKSPDQFFDDFYRENSSGLNEIANFLAEEKIPVCTTMDVDEVVLLKNFFPDKFLARPENIYLEKGYIESFLAGDEKHLNQCRGVEDICAAKVDIDKWILQGLQREDVLLILGTDSGTGGMGIIPGYSIHDELRLLVENGLSPYQALLTGTVNAANVFKEMGGDGNFGTIEAGMKADLILIGENPLVFLGALEDPIGVMAAGRWYDQETLHGLIEIK